MAIGWFTVLKSVPWTTVISNAPVVAEGAKKLWKAVGSKKPEQQAEEVDQPTAAATGDAVDAATMQAQLAQVKAASDRLEEQMLASSELINALAEQNAQLIQLVETNRVRTLWLSRLAALLAVASLGAIGLILIHLGSA